MATKKKSGEYYAWSDLYGGGEVEQREAPGGRLVKVVMSRNIINRGEKVTQAQLKVEDDEWENLLAGGSVREYPIPDGADAYTSPHRAVMQALVGPDGEIDVNKVMELQNIEALAVPPTPINPPAEDAKELPVGA